MIHVDAFKDALPHLLHFAGQVSLEFLKLIWFIKLSRNCLCKEGVKFMAMQDSATRPLNHVSEYTAHEQQVGGDISWIEHTGRV